MVARVHHPDLASPDQALPVLLRADLPPLVGALTLASVFAAEVSAADAVLFMLSTSLSQDLYRRFVAPEADDDRVVRVARWSAVVAGVAGLGMALVLPTVVDALKIFYSVLTVALFVPVVGGLLWARPQTADVIASMVTGLSAMLAVQLITAGKGIYGWPPVVIGLLSGGTAFGAAMLLRGAR
jgi:SSS family solute:Na+ symporter